MLWVTQKFVKYNWIFFFFRFLGDDDDVERVDDVPAACPETSCSRAQARAEAATSTATATAALPWHSPAVRSAARKGKAK